MKKAITLLFLIAGITLQSSAQLFDWVSFTPSTTYAGNNSFGGYCVTTDDEGNIYSVTNFLQPVIVGSDTVYHGGAASKPDILITKWNPAGEVMGYRHFRNFSGSGDLDPEKIVYDEVNEQVILSISSYFASTQVTLVGDSTVADTTLYLTKGSVIRFDKNLDFVSKANIPGDWQANTPIATKDGFLYTSNTGYYSSSIAKFDVANNMLWSLTPTGTVGRFDITSITISNQDTIYVVGYFTSNGVTTVTLGGVSITSPPGAYNQVGIFKIDTAGNVVAGKYLCQAHYNSNPIQITTDTQGYVYVAAPYDVTGQVLNHSLNITPSGVDGFVAKLNPDLQSVEWVTELKDDGNINTNSIMVHPSGKITLVGHYSGNATFGNFPLAFSKFGTGFIAQFDNATGNILYATNVGGLTSGTGRAFGVANAGNKYYISGQSFGSNNTNPAYTASYGCFGITYTGQFLTCFVDTAPPIPQTNFSYIREQNKVYFSSGITDGQFVSIDFGNGKSTTVQTNPTHVYGKGLFTAVLTTKKDCYVRKDTLLILFKGIQKVLPEKIANNQLQIIFVKGGFPFASTSGLNVQLRKGASIINAVDVAVNDSGTVQGNFLLYHELLGFYDVIVAGPGGFADTLVNGLEMVPEDNAPLTLQQSGRDKRIINRYATHQIIVSNPGNVNQFGVPVYIVMPPQNQVGKLSNNILTDSIGNVIRARSFTHDFTMAFDSLSNDSVLLAAFIIPMVAAHSSEMIEFYVKATTLGTIPIYSVLGKPMYDSTQLSLLGLRTSCDFFADPAACVFDLLGQVPGLGCPGSAANIGCSIGNLGRDVVGNRNKGGNITKYISDVFNLIADVAGAIVCEVGGDQENFVKDLLMGTVINQVFGISAQGVTGQTQSIPLGVPGGLNIPGSCSDAFRKDGLTGAFKTLDDFTRQDFIFKSMGSMDPNDKIGPVGFTPENYFGGQSRVHYTIRFENVPTATAPASVVEVYDTLDANFFDLSSLRFTGFGFADSTYQILNADKSYAQEIDLRPAKNTILRFQAKLDSANHNIVWKFTSLHPATRAEVDSISDGFLNPNTTSPEGEGYVSFSIMPKANRPHLQQVSNSAKIVFDANAPIFTKLWINTVDKVKPTSNVLPLPSVINDTTFYISWLGNDDHSGINSYDIFVTVNDTSHFLLLNKTSADSFQVLGKFGYNYKFFSRAIDHAGNVEDLSSTPDAVVTLQLPSAIKDLQNKMIELFPNPANDLVTIKLGEAAKENTAITITNINGAIKMQQVINAGTSSKQINMMHLPAGIYFVNVQHQHENRVFKLVKF